MASALHYDNTLRSNMMDQITSAVGSSGLIKIYSGTAPANVAASITGTLLVTLTCNATFAPGASSGVLTLNSITAGTAVATGTATHFRITTSGGTAKIQGSVGTSLCDLNLTNTSINTGDSVSIGAGQFTITEGNA